MFPNHLLQPVPSTRRDFLKRMGSGFGSVALAALAEERSAAGAGAASVAQSAVPIPLPNPLAPKRPHFRPRAKRVIFLWMQGGPSQMDLFDYKPRLASEGGNKIPFATSAETERFQDTARLLSPVSTLKQVGQSGTWWSDLLPNLSRKVDEMSILRAM